MEKFKIGKNKLRVSLPSGWHEVPFDKGVTILEGEMSEVEIMSLLSGVDKKELEESTDFETIFYLMNAYTFLKTLPDLTTPQIPRSVKFNNDIVIFPHVIYSDKFDLGKISVGQIKDMEMVITNMLYQIGEDGIEKKEVTNFETIRICPYLVAIFLQKVIDKKYDYDKAMKMVDEVSRQLSFKEVIHMGYFFLQRLSVLRLGSRKGSLKLGSMKRRFRRALMSLMQRMGLTPRWT